MNRYDPFQTYEATSSDVEDKIRSLLWVTMCDLWDSHSPIRAKNEKHCSRKRRETATRRGLGFGGSPVVSASCRYSQLPRSPSFLPAKVLWRSCTSKHGAPAFRCNPTLSIPPHGSTDSPEASAIPRYLRGGLDTQAVRRLAIPDSRLKNAEESTKGTWPFPSIVPYSIILYLIVLGDDCKSLSFCSAASLNNFNMFTWEIRFGLVHILCGRGTLFIVSANLWVWAQSQQLMKQGHPEKARQGQHPDVNKRFN